MCTTSSGASLRAQSAAARDVAAGARKRPGKAKPQHFDSFSLVKKNGKPKAATRDFMHALDRALPVNGGQGDYWRDQVLRCGATYPPTGASTPPRECERFGDRGRLYPGYYVRSHASSLVHRGKRRKGFVCCLDCFNELWERRRIDFAVYCGEIPGGDGVAVNYDQPTDDVEPAADGSPSAEALQHLADQATEDDGPRLVEMKLEPADEASIKRMIDRHVSGQKVITLQPFA